ncbi:hypothetical protein QO003_000365 [Arthrobacter silviterrae]|uniref:DUF4129 domain-containing protein n=1 Tax=Arthrobacter silviterrae TaxID=2026658 RepID=A0ABX0DEZ2_9MICC|nr:hypothetical protein [Arthrobacter silviterrae]MDQ0276062.1 hypothetical protein [Arthrobacter silviterrae]NGN84306.1 hypothetical protein [Arthrobacter silviterrae]
MVVEAVAQLVAVAAVVVSATGGTAWLVKSRPALEKDPDSAFWYGFAGLCIVAPAVLLTTAANRWAGAALAALAAATWLFCARLFAQVLASRATIRARQLDDAVRHSLAARQDAVALRWSRFELDPAAAIDFPDMTDVRVAETALLARAMAKAEALRYGPEQALAGYREAVAALEQAYRRAEWAAVEGRGQVSGDVAARLASP